LEGVNMGSDMYVCGFHGEERESRLNKKVEELQAQLAALREENDSAKEALEVALATIYSWAIDGHADWCESQCNGDHCTCGHVGAREMLEIPKPEGE
jgi:hypothetical protein